MAQIQSSNLYAIAAKTIDTRPNEVIALIRKNGVMIPDGASSQTIDKAFASLITKSKAFQVQFAQLATKTVLEGNATLSFDGSVAKDGAFNNSSLMFHGSLGRENGSKAPLMFDGSVGKDGAFKNSNLMFDGSVGQDGAFKNSTLSFDGSVGQDGAFKNSNLMFDGSVGQDGAFKNSTLSFDSSLERDGAMPLSRFNDVSDEVNFSGAGLTSSSSNNPPKAPAPIKSPASGKSSTSNSTSNAPSKKSGSGIGSYFTPEFVQGLLSTGLGIWAYSKTGKTPQEVQGNLDEGRNDPNYNANNNQPKGLSTTGVVLISLGVITAIGVAVYFMRKK
jgi:hypothetical protein